MIGACDNWALAVLVPLTAALLVFRAAGSAFGAVVACDALLDGPFVL